MNDVAAQAALPLAPATVSYASGLTTVVAGTVETQVFALFAPVVEAGAEVAVPLAVEDGTRLDRATFVLAASPGGSDVRADSVATVRAAEPVSEDEESACVLDFGRLVTVDGVSLLGSGVPVRRVRAWTGTGWQPFGRSVAAGGGFPEVMTERLLVTSGESDVEQAVRTHGRVSLPVRPTGLELLVDGTTVWFERQGSTAGLPAPTPAAGAVQHVVDRTDAVRAALARARSEAGSRVVSVVLRAASPGLLTLQPTTSLLHEHAVTFGTSAHSATIDAVEEGVHALALGRPFAAADSIRRVSLTVRGAFGPERVEPVEGPDLVGDTTLLLDSGRTVLLGIPAALTEPFGELVAVRLHLASPRGGELAGRLLEPDATGGPGTPVRDGDVPPVPVPATEDARWLTVPLARAVPLPEPRAGTALWLELVATYGAVACSLVHDGTGTAAATLLRRLPGGGTKPLSRFLGSPVLLAALRVVGLPGNREPLPAVTLFVDGQPGAVAPVTPTPEDVGVALGFGGGIAPTEGQVPLRLRVAAAGTVTVDDVVVAYQKGAAP